MRVPGLKRAKLLGRWLTSRFAGRALILGYHRIANESSDFYSICVRPELFAEHLQVLVQSAHVISLDNLAKALRDDAIPERSVAITFDDGYADNLYQAKPLLEQYDAPATLFVASGYLGSHFWWDELVQLIMKSQLADEVTLKIGGEHHHWPVGSSNGAPGGGSAERTALMQDIYHLLLELPNEERKAALDQVRQQANEGHGKLSEMPRAMTVDELRQLADCSLVTIGAHTVSHPVLTSLPNEIQRREIVQSKDDLETMLGRPVTTFSYPNGAADERTRKLVNQAGFNSACTSFNDVVRPGSNLLWLPRFWMPDWDGETFNRWLKRWL